jgi:hypothetical protein
MHESGAILTLTIKEMHWQCRYRTAVKIKSREDRLRGGNN